MTLPTPAFLANSQSQCSSHLTIHNSQIPLSEFPLSSFLLGEFLIDLLELKGISARVFPQCFCACLHYNIYYVALQQNWLHTVPPIWLVLYLILYPSAKKIVYFLFFSVYYLVLGIVSRTKDCPLRYLFLLKSSHLWRGNRLMNIIYRLIKLR